MEMERTWMSDCQHEVNGDNSKGGGHVWLTRRKREKSALAMGSPCSFTFMPKFLNKIIILVIYDVVSQDFLKMAN